MRKWIAVGLLLAALAPAGANEYTYYGPPRPRKKTTAAPALKAVPPRYTQTHDEPPAVAPVRTYTQTHSPGPNSGKAANGTWTPGGASILSTGPLYYPFPWGGNFAPVGLSPGQCAPPPRCEAPPPPRVNPNPASPVAPTRPAPAGR